MIIIMQAVAISRFLEKYKKTAQKEQTSRESSSIGLNGNELPRAAEEASYSAPSATPQVPSESSIEASKTSHSIYTLHSALDSEEQ